MHVAPEKTPAHKGRLPAALSIAGSDSGAGAGIQADLLTFAANHVFGTTSITCLTAQNPDGVDCIHPVPALFVRAQIDAILSYFPIRAAKTGMLFDAAVVREVACALSAHPRIWLVVDPVMVATSGSMLLKPDAVDAMVRLLFPLADLITPNLDEAGALLGRTPANRSEVKEAAVTLAARFGTCVLLKGGHLRGDQLLDVLAYANGRSRVYTSTRIHGVDTHGSGCTLSAAITAQLARGRTLEESIAAARRFLRGGMRRPLTVRGRSFIAHRPTTDGMP